MAFIPVYNADGAVAPYEYLPNGGNVGYGSAVAFDANGKITRAAGSVMPEYIAMKASFTMNEIVPCIRIDHNTVYETELSATGTSLKPGMKVTLNSGDKVTATTTDGVAEIVAMEGTATGSKVRVRF